MSSSSTTEPSADRRKELHESLRNIRSRVKTCSLPNKLPTLVAVSKYKPPSDILGCYQEGHLDFGENYVQELERKASTLPPDIRWHFIGTLQSNKAKTLAAIPNLYSIHALGSIKSANALNKALPDERIANPLKVLLQVNTSGEDTKSGLPPLTSSTDLEEAELVSLARHVVTKCPKLRLEGLMTIGSLEPSSAASGTEQNADFEKLKETCDFLSNYLKKLQGDDGSSESRWGDEASGRLLLSMGMSSDFEVALKSGSDIVRVGTGIFDWPTYFFIDIYKQRIRSWKRNMVTTILGESKQKSRERLWRRRPLHKSRWKLIR